MRQEAAEGWEADGLQGSQGWGLEGWRACLGCLLGVLGLPGRGRGRGEESEVTGRAAWQGRAYHVGFEAPGLG